MNRNHYKTNHKGELIESKLIDFSWKEVRERRDNELNNSDWRFMSDQTPTQEWIDYRQFLRDLPSNFESSNDAADAWNEYEIPE